MNRPVRARRGFTLVELLVVASIIAVLIALLLPALSGAREAARRVKCTNSLKQIVMATHTYANVHNVLPAGVVDAAGPIRNEPLGYHFGWVVQVLPQLEQGPLATSFDTSGELYAAINLKGRSAVINALLCPSDYGPTLRRDGVAENNYAACHHDVEAPIDVDNHGAFFLNSFLRFEQIGDGTSTTIFVGEKLRNDSDLGWASGTRATLRNTGSPINSVDPADALLSGPAPKGGGIGTGGGGGPSVAAGPRDPSLVGGFGSRHPGGANFGFGDGSVRFVRETIHQDVYRFLGHRDDGEMIDDSRF